MIWIKYPEKQTFILQTISQFNIPKKWYYFNLKKFNVIFVKPATKIFQISSKFLILKHYILESKFQMNFFSILLRKNLLNLIW